MNRRSLIIGMGIGQLYKEVLTELGHSITTVDPDPKKNANFTNLRSLLGWHEISEPPRFDTVHICTPNYTHAIIAQQVAPYSKIIFIEKPGLQSSNEWSLLLDVNRNTRITMVKNNQWRNNISQLTKLTKKAKLIRINWINKDRVPNPGTWFTDKKLSFGGVSRDLMPHLLSLLAKLSTYKDAKQLQNFAKQNWKLADLTQTDYGTVKADGIYNVDDACQIQFMVKDKPWILEANWRSNNLSKVNIEFIMQDDTEVTIDLGLCPQAAYSDMISDSIANLDNDSYWEQQNAMDLWIHQQIDSLCK